MTNILLGCNTLWPLHSSPIVPAITESLAGKVLAVYLLEMVLNSCMVSGIWGIIYYVHWVYSVSSCHLPQLSEINLSNKRYSRMM